jgi:hypothetical protein
MNPILPVRKSGNAHFSAYWPLGVAAVLYGVAYTTKLP